MTGSSPSISQTLAQFFYPLKFEDLAEDLVYKAKTFFLDWLASAFAGYLEQPTQIMLSVANEMPGSHEATIITNNTKHLPIIAALVNGAASHVVEMDDLHRPSIFHPAAAILPAVFAAAEKQHVSGEKLILGIVTGYEIGIRTALAAGKSHYEYWHTTSTCGALGAAAGSAKVLALGPEAFVWALGSAGTQSAGLWEFLTDAAMSKQLHTGKSCMNGLLAALLAEKGFTGATHIFEGKKGFMRATSRDYDLGSLTQGLGETFHTARNSLKYYASCGHTHTAVESALKVRSAIQDKIPDIESVKVLIYQEALGLLKDVEPSTPYFAKFSLPFCVALALKKGHVDIDDFTVENINDPEIKDLMGVISFEAESDLTRVYPEKWPSRIEIKMKNGDTYKAGSEYPKGDPQNPLSEEELIGKFSKLCGSTVPEVTRKRIIDLALNMEEVSDVTAFFNS